MPLPNSRALMHHFQSLSIIILSWNIRGLNARIKRSSLRKLVLNHKPNFTLIQETKMETLDKRILKSICNDDQAEFVLSPSQGNSGGLLTVWNNDFFSMESCKTAKNWIALCGVFPATKFKGCIINIYNPCECDERATVWSELQEFWNQTHLPCLIIGDFNEVLSPSDRGSQLVNQKGMDDFNNFVHDMLLTEIPATNRWFTWFRGASKSKLDRLFVNPKWIATFPNLKVSLLKRSLSDHCPLLTKTTDRNWGPKPFRFQNCWLSYPGCLKFIRENWKQDDRMQLNKKLNLMKLQFKEWNSNVFGHIDHNINALEEKIQKLDSTSNNRELDESELSERKKAQQDLWTWLKRKEVFWAQNSRAKWLKEGDKNTWYFHTLASIRKRKNSISSLPINGCDIVDPAGLKREEVKYFQEIFTEEHPNQPTFNGLAFRQISPHQSSSLIAPFSKKEIDEAVASCNAQKSPGPDGFNFSFIKSAWDIIKEDIYRMVDDF